MLPFLILKCSKIFIVWGFAPDPAGKLTDPLAVWDGNLVTTCGGQLSAPLLVTGAPCCCEAGHRPAEWA